jgi:RHS repeat-associated protein
MQYTPSSSYHPVAYVYDLIGDMTSYTNGEWVTFTQSFNAAGRPTQATSSISDSQHPGTLVSGIHYNAAGSVAAATLGNGLTQSAAYNARLQPCRTNVNSSGTVLGSCTAATPSGNVLDLSFGFNYGSGDNGNLMSFSAVGAQTFNRGYTYDAVNRLSTMSSPGSGCSGLSWTYDAWGNRTDQTVTGGTCNTFHASVSANNQLTGTPYQYDAAGNKTHDASHSYTYDAENRLSQVDGGATAIYTYDAEGRRAWKKIGSTTTSYFRDLSGAVLTEDLVSTWGPGYIYLNGKLLAEYANSATYFAHEDHLGSTRLLTGYPTPGVAECDDYYPFGELISCGGSTTYNTHKFTGKERDSESNLDNFEARYDSSTLGRFMSPDETFAGWDQHDPESLNRYSYVENNPLSAIDPDGHDVMVCVNNGNGHFNCVKYTDQQYQNLLNTQNGKQGIVLPGGKFPNRPITCDGQVCGFARYFEPPLESDNAVNFAIGGVFEMGMDVGFGIIEGMLGKEGVEEGTSVIGKMADLEKPGGLRPGEKPLNLKDLGDPKANWAQNSSKLREAMREGDPIRDASAGNPGSNTGFLRAERNLLENHGWTMQSDGYWHPPGK